jgi:hypothetical protein
VLAYSLKALFWCANIMLCANLGLLSSRCCLGSHYYLALGVENRAL